jgi:ABC-type transport system involved in multi-copper enzyme maturation permease subunit
MKWLLWKDYRHNRPIVMATLFLLVAPHLMGLFATCFLNGDTPSGRPRWVDNLGISSICSLLACQLALLLIGGNAIAGERADRSAEFLASLPVSRRRILASKLLLALAIIAAIWLTNAPVLFYLTLSQGGPDLRGLTQMLVVTAITVAAFFSIAWLLSCYLSSPTFAVAGGLVAPLAVQGTSVFVAYLLGLNFDIYVVRLYCGICLVAAPVCFAVGTWYYLRRVEP